MSSHESVYLNVQKGFALAGGGIERTLDSAQKEGLRGIRVLWRSEGFTPHAIAVNPQLAQEDTDRLQRALINLADTGSGRKILEGVNLQPLTSAEHSDWDDIRHLGLDFMQIEEDQ